MRRRRRASTTDGQAAPGPPHPSSKGASSLIAACHHSNRLALLRRRFIRFCYYINTATNYVFCIGEEAFFSFSVIMKNLPANFGRLPRTACGNNCTQRWERVPIRVVCGMVHGSVRPKPPMIMSRGKNRVPLDRPCSLYTPIAFSANLPGLFSGPFHDRTSYVVLFRSTLYISSVIRRPIDTIVFFLLFP